MKPWFHYGLGGRTKGRLKLEIHLSIMLCGTGVVWPIKVESQGRDACWPSVGLSTNGVMNIN